ncbi:MAG: hypothetical protein QOD74_1214 [Variibacter sp.]|nr:hypothetical protein [Variibacter sp.]
MNGPLHVLSKLRRVLLLRWQLFLYRFSCAILNYPFALKVGFAFLRRIRPTTILRNRIAIVTKADDVRDVLSRLEDFNTGPVLLPKMPWGPFVVTLDWPEQHSRERSLLESIVSRDRDATSIRQRAAAACQSYVRERRNVAEINVVTELCEPLVVDLVRNYLGVPIGGDSNVAARILSDVAGVLMVEPPAGSTAAARAHAGLITLTQMITQKIESVSRDGPQGDDLLTRLVVKLGVQDGVPDWFDQSWIRRYITGLTVFGAGTIVRATAQAIDRLMAHPANLREAVEVAKRIHLSGDGAPQQLDEDRTKLLHFIYESLRFRPMLPILPRYVPRQTIIAKGASHARLTPAGCLLLAPLLAAMYDPEQFCRPWQFRSDRPLGRYVHFGYGPRLCFGRYIADALMLETFIALLQIGKLKRVAGTRGRLAYDGPSVRSLVLAIS